MDFNTIQSLQEAYDQVSQLMELTGGKGHPGYKAGSKDHGPMQSGHPADTFKRTMKGGTMSMRHGDHLGDLDDNDDEEDDLEAGLKDTARKKRENVRKPLRDKVKAARKAMTKENYEPDAFDIVLEYLVAEGYADTNKAALAIMTNMSEEWRQDIVEKYVDYEKGKLSTGKSPKQRLAARHERVKATAAKERGEASSTDSLMTPATKRAEKLGSVRREMDDNTSTAGKVRKAIHLGRRDNAGPSVQRGEPNTERHQRGIDTREKSEK